MCPRHSRMVHTLVHPSRLATGVCVWGGGGGVTHKSFGTLNALKLHDDPSYVCPHVARHETQQFAWSGARGVLDLHLTMCLP